MNIYFLVEGSQTEIKVYPQWLSYLAPKLSRVDFAHQAVDNNYYLMSGMGSPRILHVELANAVAEINELGNYNYLVLVIDADNMSEQEKIEEVEMFMANHLIALDLGCDLKIIAQNYCIETWFLGNQAVYPDVIDKNSDFYEHAQFYNVSQQDPELMNKPQWFINGTTSIYHEIYLRKMLAKSNIRYSKSNPKSVAEKPYLEQLRKRVTESSHLASLKHFFDFCELITAKN